MSGNRLHHFSGLFAVSLTLALLTGPAAAQNAASLRYGFKKGQQYGYDVKIVAQTPDEDVTHQGTLTYFVLSATDDQFALKCVGNLIKSVKPNPDAAPASPLGLPGFGGPPMMPGPPRFGPPGFGPMSQPMQPEGTTFNRQGGIVIFGNSSSLPHLLGDQVELIIEALPNEAKANWEKQTDLGVIERNESGPFFRPFGPGSATETNRGAKEQITYAVLEKKSNSVRISKNYSIKTAPESGGVTHINMSGNGEFEFDLKDGIISSQTMKYNIQVNEKNVNVTIPVTLTYHRVSDVDMAERKKKADTEAAARAEANKPKPLAPGERANLLKDLRSGDEKRVSDAAVRLGKSIPDDNPADVAKALCLAYKKTNPWIQQRILAAIAVWCTPDCEKTVIEASGSNTFFVRNDAIVLLGKFKTAAAAQAAASHLKDQRGGAVAALKQMGPSAESYVLPFLKEDDFWIRKDLCDLLAEIGGKKGLQALKNAKAKVPDHQATFFNHAIEAIEKRIGTDADDAPTEADEEAKTPAAGEPKMHTWRDVTGTYEVEAEFVKAEADKVTIKRADGKTITLAIKKLSKADREYVEQQKKAQEEKPENPFE